MADKMMNLNKINSIQKNILADFMAEHPDLARNIFPNSSQGKTTSLRLWEKLTSRLNSKGPPIKDLKAWRKTFADQKYQIKSKMSFKKLSKKKTGGGPYEEKMLSQMDELIVSAAGLEASVEGLNSKKFGIQTKQELREEILSESPGCSYKIDTEPKSPSPNYSVEYVYDSPSPPSAPAQPAPAQPSPAPPTSGARKIKCAYTPKKKEETKLGLLKEKILSENVFQTRVINALEKHIELEERKVKIQERILEIKENKHNVFLEVNAIELQIKKLQLEDLKTMSGF